MIRKLPAVESRVETGPIRFGDDWPGSFIRGDEAAWYASCLEAVLDGTAARFQQIALVGLLGDLKDSNLRNHPEEWGDKNANRDGNSETGSETA
jgi:hypothetical protein